MYFRKYQETHKPNKQSQSIFSKLVPETEMSLMANVLHKINWLKFGGDLYVSHNARSAQARFKTCELYQD